jgi:hypothetical protein
LKNDRIGGHVQEMSQEGGTGATDRQNKEELLAGDPLLDLTIRKYDMTCHA